jgi:hypothetical protein
VDFPKSRTFSLGHLDIFLPPYVCTSRHTYRHTYTHTLATSLCTHMHTHTHTYTHIHLLPSYACTHTHTNTHTHIHLLAYTNARTRTHKLLEKGGGLEGEERVGGGERGERIYSSTRNVHIPATNELCLWAMPWSPPLWTFVPKNLSLPYKHN